MSGRLKIYLPGMQTTVFCLFLFIALTCVSTPGYCASLTVLVTDNHGAPVENVVIFAEPVSGKIGPKPGRTAEIAQISRRFDPLVTVIQTGTEVSFPNKDTVKHHVYSFSSAKVFDLPLYSGKASAPQMFNKAGTVVLGCNIHDNMVAYVQVVDTPYFAKTDGAGKAIIEGISPGKYNVKAWSYKLPPLDQTVAKPFSIGDAENELSFKLGLN